MQDLDDLQLGILTLIILDSQQEPFEKENWMKWMTLKRIYS